MRTDKKLNIIISVLIITSVIVAFMVSRSVRDAIPENSQEKTDGIIEDLDTKDIPSGISVEGDGDLEFEAVPVTGQSYPDLNRPVVISENGVSPETETIARERISELSAELRDNPELHGTWLDLAAYRKLIGDFFGAIEIWEFVGARSEDYISYKNLGMLYHYDLPDYPLSESYFKKSVARGPEYIPTYLEFHDLYKLSYVEKADQADDILLEGLSKNPGNILLLSTLARYFADGGDTATARGYYEEALTEAQKLGDTATATQIQSLIDSLQ